MHAAAIFQIFAALIHLAACGIADEEGGGTCGSDELCSAGESNPVPSRWGERDCPRSESVDLPELEDSWAERRDKIFFIESSDRPTMNHRQVCSIESAARNSGKQYSAFWRLWFFMLYFFMLYFFMLYFFMFYILCYIFYVYFLCYIFCVIFFLCYIFLCYIFLLYFFMFYFFMLYFLCYILFAFFLCWRHFGVSPLAEFPVQASKVAKLRKLHHDKTIKKSTFFTFF